LDNVMAGYRIHSTSFSIPFFQQKVAQICIYYLLLSIFAKVYYKGKMAITPFHSYA
jgi:hypothetical protein